MAETIHHVGVMVEEARRDVEADQRRKQQAVKESAEKINLIAALQEFQQYLIAREGKSDASIYQTTIPDSQSVRFLLVWNITKPHRRLSYRMATGISVIVGDQFLAVNEKIPSNLSGSKFENVTKDDVIKAFAEAFVASPKENQTIGKEFVLLEETKPEPSPAK